jgi:hypothetical protein
MHALGGFILFGRNTIGIVFRPYETYRRIVDRGSAWESVYIGLCAVLYFVLASVVKESAFRPYLLTQQVVVLTAGTFLGYLLMVSVIYITGKHLGSKGNISGVAKAWGYTLIPTILWFLFTSLLYIILPPPRTTRPQGIIFSIVYLVISTVLFSWKVTLGYLTMRFGLRLGFGKITVVTIVILVVSVLYSVFMYQRGIFKVPFL